MEKKIDVAEVIESQVEKKRFGRKAKEASSSIKDDHYKKTGNIKVIKDDKVSVATIDSKRVAEMSEIEIQGEIFYAKDIILQSPYYNYYKEKILRKKHLIFLFFFDFCNRNKSRTAELLGISRQNFYNWEKENKDFKNLMRDKADIALIDRAEEVLRDHLEDNSFKAAEFVLKTKGGYNEKKEVENKTEVSVVGFAFKPMEAPKDPKEAEAIEHDVLDAEVE